METISRLNAVHGRLKNSAVAMGTFDGVHLGHRSIITRAVALAKEHGGPSVVFTFSNHPLSVIAPRRCPPQITTDRTKHELIRALGVDVLVDIPFDRDLLYLPPRVFAAELLAEHFQPSFVVVGPNFTFGYKGAGTPDFLRQMGKIHSFEVVIPPACYVGDTLVSSTAIRQFIQKGRMEKAAALLGRPVSISGRVEHGEGRGRSLGFPTANMQIPEGLVIPRDGVYAAGITVGSDYHKGLANIGNNPTFPNQSRRIEVNIFDFDADLYGQEITVDFLTKLRDEKSFDGVDSLRRQIQKDATAARIYWG